MSSNCVRACGNDSSYVGPYGQCYMPLQLNTLVPAACFSFMILSDGCGFAWLENDQGVGYRGLSVETGKKWYCNGYTSDYYENSDCNPATECVDWADFTDGDDYIDGPAIFTRILAPLSFITLMAMSILHFTTWCRSYPDSQLRGMAFGTFGIALLHLMMFFFFASKACTLPNGDGSCRIGNESGLLLPAVGLIFLSGLIMLTLPHTKNPDWAWDSGNNDNNDNNDDNDDNESASQSTDHSSTTSQTIAPVDPSKQLANSAVPVTAL